MASSSSSLLLLVQTLLLTCLVLFSISHVVLTAHADGLRYYKKIFTTAIPIEQKDAPDVKINMTPDDFKLCKLESILVIAGCLTVPTPLEINADATLHIKSVDKSFPVTLLSNKVARTKCFSIDTCELYNAVRAVGLNEAEKVCPEVTGNDVLSLHIKTTGEAAANSKLEPEIIFSGSTGPVGAQGIATINSDNLNALMATTETDNAESCKVDEKEDGIFKVLIEEGKFPKCVNLNTASLDGPSLFKGYVYLKKVAVDADEDAFKTAFTADVGTIASEPASEVKITCTKKQEPQPNPTPQVNKQYKAFQNVEKVADAAGKQSVLLNLPNNKLNLCTQPVVVSGCLTSTIPIKAAEIQIGVKVKVPVKGTNFKKTSPEKKNEYCFFVSSCEIYEVIQGITDYECVDEDINLVFEGKDAFQIGAQIQPEVLVSGAVTSLSAAPHEATIHGDQFTAALATSSEMSLSCKVGEAELRMVSKTASNVLPHCVKTGEKIDAAEFVGYLYEEEFDKSAIVFSGEDKDLNKHPSTVTIKCSPSKPSPPPPSGKHFKAMYKGAVPTPKAGEPIVVDLTVIAGGPLDVCAVPVVFSGCISFDVAVALNSEKSLLVIKGKEGPELSVPMDLRKSDGKTYCLVVDGCKIFDTASKTSGSCVKADSFAIKLVSDAAFTAAVTGEVKILGSSYYAELPEAKKVTLGADTFSAGLVKSTDTALTCAVESPNTGLVQKVIGKKGLAPQCRNIAEKNGKDEELLGYLYSRLPAANWAKIELVDTDFEKDASSTVTVDCTKNITPAPGSSTTTTSGVTAPSALASVATAATIMAILLNGN